MQRAISRILNKNKELHNFIPFVFSNSRFLLKFDSNDKRTIKGKIEAVVNIVKEKISSINKRVNLDLKVAILPIGKNSNLDIDDILKKLSDTMLSIKNNNLNMLIYDKDLILKDLKAFEEELTISEEIDEGKLNLYYYQIISLDSKMIYSYIVSLESITLPNLKKSFDKIVRFRNLEVKIDKYKIERTISDIKKLHDKTK